VGDIDWTRVGVPQEDGYDTEVTKQLALERYGWEKKWPEKGDLTWLDGKVLLVEPTDHVSVRHTPAKADHPHIALAEQFLRQSWPEMFVQCQELLQSLHIYILDGARIQPMGFGCSCGPKGDRVSFEIMVTINGALGILEGVVHELAHNKMKDHGISLYHWERLLTTPHATEVEIELGRGPNVYLSPFRKDKLRPMGACLSAHYSYLHVAEMILKLVSSGSVRADDCEQWLRLQKARCVEGQELIDHQITTDVEGASYFASLTTWAKSITGRVDELFE